MDNLLERITIVPGLCGGKPTIRGMRMTVSMILEHLSAGDTIEEILEAFPFLEKEDLLASQLYAADMGIEYRTFERQSLEEYNNEIAEAEEEIEKGNFISAEDLKKESRS